MNNKKYLKIYEITKNPVLIIIIINKKYKQQNRYLKNK